MTTETKCDQDFQRYGEELGPLLEAMESRANARDAAGTGQAGGAPQGAGDTGTAQNETAQDDGALLEAMRDLLAQMEMSQASSPSETFRDMPSHVTDDVPTTTPKIETFRDIPGHGTGNVPTTTPENETFRDMPSHATDDVPTTTPEIETFRDIPGHATGDVPTATPKSETFRDMPGHDRLAERIEAFAAETSERVIDPSDPTSLVNRRQMLAISGLLSGSTVTFTANLIGVDRRTVHRWMHDPKFQAAYRFLEDDLRMAARAEVAGLTERAVRCVAEGLDRGNTRVALDLLKLLQVFSNRTTPERMDKAEERTALLLERTE
jgi:hypothetical protein